MTRRCLPACLVLVALLAGCATMPTDPAALAVYRANHDPLEPLNRKVFQFNLAVDQWILKPIAKEYVALLPPFAREGLRNFLKNLHEPIVFANNGFQGDARRTAKTGARFLINSAMGLGGLVDVANLYGFTEQGGDFGQTLFVWGASEGPYLILPVIGPSNPRDAIGSGVDIFLDPFRYVAKHNNYPTALSVGQQALAGIDERSRHIDDLDEIQKESVDYYASLRSLMRQNRESELRHGAPPSAPQINDFYNDPDAPAPSGSPHA